jgi:hypothetical protein
MVVINADVLARVAICSGLLVDLSNHIIDHMFRLVISLTLMYFCLKANPVVIKTASFMTC